MMRLVLSCLLIFFASELVSQQLFTRQYTIRDGLKHSEIYWVSLDEDNQVWVHNGEGWFARYDGIDFSFLPKDSTRHSGFSSHMVFKGEYGFINSQLKELIMFKKDGSYFSRINIPDIFAGPYLSEGQVCVSIREKYKILCYDVNLNVIDSINIPIQNIDFLDPKKQYAGLHRYSINPDQPILYFTSMDKEPAKYIYNKNTKENRQTNNRYLELMNSSYLIKDDSRNRNIQVVELKDSLSLDFNTILSFPPSDELAGITSLGKQHYFFVIKSNKDDKGSSLYLWDEEHLLEKGYLPTTQQIGPAQITSNELLWIGSHEGLYKVNPHLLYFSTSEENMISAIHSIVEDQRDNIWFAGYKTGLSYYDGIEIIAGPRSPTNKLNYLPGGALIDEKATFLISGNEPVVIIDNNKIKRKRLKFDPPPSRNITGYLIKEIGSTIYLGLMDKGLGIVENSDNENWYIKNISHEKGLFLDNVLTISEDLYNRIWVGRSSQGVGLYDPKIDSAYTWLLKTENPNSFGSISSTLDQQGNLWMGTNKGLYFLENPHEVNFGDNLFAKAKYIPFPDDDRSMVVSVIESHDYIVAGNNTAVNFVDLDSFYQSNNHPLIYSLKYGEDIGGDGTEQNCMLNDSKGYLWIGSQTGATRMDLKNYPFDNSPIKVELTGVKVGQKPIQNVSSIISIPKDNRNFSLTLRPKINRSLQNNIYYNYELVSDKKDTLLRGSHINQPEIQMSYIAPGNYNLHVSAYKNGRKYDELSVEVKVPYTLSENPFFWAGLIGITLIGLASYIIIRGRQKRKLLEKDLALSKLKNDKTNLQVQAIISSFNPHFINNSLHWAQSRYKKDQSLVTLIGRLSKNIQYIFDKTRKGKAFHSLKEELELVKNYVTIQKIRFDDGFDLHLPDNVILQNYASFPVVLMQIQIHVENAIEHGLRNRIDSSEVKVSISEDADNLIIKITDDGGGRNKAEQLNSKGTQKGTNMLEQLHSIFNKNNSNKIITVYEDDIFTNPTTNDNYGTRVIISIPKYYNYELEKT